MTGHVVTGWALKALKPTSIILLINETLGHHF